jgi:hypothetical protein
VLIYALLIVEELHPFFHTSHGYRNNDKTMERNHKLTSNNGLHRPIHLRSRALVDTIVHKMIRAIAGGRGTHGGSLVIRYYKDCLCSQSYKQRMKGSYYLSGRNRKHLKINA